MTEAGWLVVGLGNPAARYARTRHNLGHLVADELAARVASGWRTHRTRRADVAEGWLGSPPRLRVTLAKPRSFMNESGGPVAALAAFYKTPVDRVVVVHDDLDLQFGAIRVKAGGGDGGHNGLRSLRRSLGSGDFYRVRIGIGRPTGPEDPADFVLSGFTPDERPEVPLVVDRAADAVEQLLLAGLRAAQNRFHG